MPWPFRDFIVSLHPNIFSSRCQIQIRYSPPPAQDLPPVPSPRQKVPRQGHQSHTPQPQTSTGTSSVSPTTVSSWQPTISLTRASMPISPSAGSRCCVRARRSAYSVPSSTWSLPMSPPTRPIPLSTTPHSVRSSPTTMITSPWVSTIATRP